MTDSATLARSYFDAWRSKDFETLRSILSEDVTFRGPLGVADGADECIRGLSGMSQIVTDAAVAHTFVATDHPDEVVTWFDLHTDIASPTATANWMHIENGQIARIRVTFDPREIVAAG
ncbi:MAG: nuclear transport factor 2 family protein [Nocardioides sp.]|nr:nuclear transport factor 2 family protein [Nocardioides sp.]